MNKSFNHHAPTRPVDWRYRAARDNVDAGRLSVSSRGDPFVKELTGYLRARAQSTTDAAKSRLAGRMPHMDRAFQIHEARDSSMRDLLEAYLLTGEPTATISAMTRLSPEVIRVYAAAFFDVADRLNLASFILEEVIFPKGSAISSGVYLKLLAYVEGSATLEELTQRSKIGTSNKLQRLMQEETRLSLLRKVVVSIREFDVRDDRTAAEILRLYFRDNGSGKQGEPEMNRLEEHAQSMMAALPFIVRGRDNAKVPPEVRKFQTTPVELTYDELCQVSCGRSWRTKRNCWP